MHIIYKYSNRKLYSYEEKGYITLSYIANLVTTEEEFQVIDKTTGSDVTKQVLISAVSEIALTKLNTQVLKAILINTENINNSIDTVQETYYTNLN